MAVPRFIADTHLGHRNIYKYRTVFESTRHNDLYFLRILQETSTKRDSMFFLGDIVFDEYYLGAIKELPGKKVLIAGNHCISTDTEVLTKNGWKLSSDITYDDLVSTVNLQTNEMLYDTPENINHHMNQKLVSVSGTYIDELVSEGHSCVYEGKRTEVNKLYGTHTADSFMYSTYDKHNGIDIEDDWIYLLQFVIADACLVQGESENKKRVQFKLAKEKKIQKLESILQKLDIKYTKQACKMVASNKLTPYYIRIYGNDAREIWNRLDGKKTAPENWRYMSKHQLDVWIEAIQDSDGYTEFNSVHLATIDKNFVDIFQHCCITNGYPCHYKEHIPKSGFRNGKLQYRIVFKTINTVNSKRKVQVTNLNETGTVVSIQMSHHTLITRRNGKVSITGNCTEYIPMKKLVDTYDEVHALLKYKEFWLSHAPLHTGELREKVNIHGHVHTASVPDVNYLNVSVDSTFMRYMPRTLTEARDAFRIMKETGQYYKGIPDERALEIIRANPKTRAAYDWALAESRKTTIIL